jgi:hypothetical protein
MGKGFDKQKMLAKSMNIVPKSLITSIVPRSITVQALDQEHNFLEEFVNLKPFKKIDVLYINEPLKIADSIEEKLNLVLRLKSANTYGCQNLFDAIALVRTEAKQDISIFDFDREDFDFAMNSANLILELSDLIKQIQQGLLAPNLSLLGDKWANWITNRIASSLHKDMIGGEVEDCGLVLILKTLTTRRMVVRVEQTTTIMKMKEMFYALGTQPIKYQYLVCKGVKLENDRCVADYQLKTDNYIHELQPIWRLPTEHRRTGYDAIDESFSANVEQQRRALAQYNASARPRSLRRKRLDDFARDVTH